VLHNSLCAFYLTILIFRTANHARCSKKEPAVIIYEQVIWAMPNAPPLNQLYQTIKGISKYLSFSHSLKITQWTSSFFALPAEFWCKGQFTVYPGYLPTLVLELSVQCIYCCFYWKGPTLRTWYITLETVIRWQPPFGLVAKIAADQVILHITG